MLCHKFHKFKNAIHKMACNLQTPLIWFFYLVVLFIVMCWTSNALCNEFSFKWWIDLYSLRPSGDVWFTYSGTAHLATWTMKTWRGSTGRISHLSPPSMVLTWAAHSTMRWGCRWSTALVLWTFRVTYLKWTVNGMCVITKDNIVFLAGWNSK